MQAQNFGAQGAATTAVMNQPQASGSNGGAPAQPRQRVRARRGQATDPHSIAERVLFVSLLVTDSHFMPLISTKINVD
jgi:hypothetical protein